MEPQSGLPADLWNKMAAYLRDIDASLGQRPRALLIVSGHWEAARATVNSASQPSLLFDYYGFPEHTYRLTYPAPGSPELAARVRDLLTQAGMPSREERARGLDHGIFIPFKLIYPNADIPIVQLSLLQNLDANAHIAMGRALAPLRDEGVLIVGSGMSYHNLRNFWTDHPLVVQTAEAFDRWLTQTVTHDDAEERAQRLISWAHAPGGLDCHPRPEHLLPLMVAAGAALADRGRQTFNDRLLGKPVSGYRFG